MAWRVIQRATGHTVVSGITTEEQARYYSACHSQPNYIEEYQEDPPFDLHQWATEEAERQIGYTETNWARQMRNICRDMLIIGYNRGKEDK